MSGETFFYFNFAIAFSFLITFIQYNYYAEFL